MNTKYYGWLGAGGYDSVVKIEKRDGVSEAYVFNRVEKDYHRNDDYLKAMWDPGSEFEEITEAEAKEIINRLSGPGKSDVEEIEEV